MKDSLWHFEVGEIPHKVTVFENVAKGGVLYLRWRAGGNWKHKSLKRTLRSSNGRIVKTTRDWARQQAKQHHEEIIQRGRTPEARAARLTIGDTIALLVDQETGKYPIDTPHRREVVRAIKFAEAVWNADTPWETIRRSHLRQLWRRRIKTLSTQGHVGARGAEVTVARILAVAQWLRDEDEGLIPTHACIPSKHWKQELRDDWMMLRREERQPEPNRPRHTADEMRSIIAAADRVDPRFALLMALGAELRLGQVCRAWHSDLMLEDGTFTVRSHGTKRGTVVNLTEGQIVACYSALSGYLAELESAGGDYRLFPAGQLPGGRSGSAHAVERHRHAKPIGRRRILEWFHGAESLTGIDSIPGRGAYGLRRAAVDAAKVIGISRGSGP